jgi:hypothetical protein
VDQPVPLARAWQQMKGLFTATNSVATKVAAYPVQLGQVTAMLSEAVAAMNAELPKVQKIAEQQQPADSRAAYVSKELMRRCITLVYRWAPLAEGFKQSVSGQLDRAATWTAQQQQMHQQQQQPREQRLPRHARKAAAQEQLCRELLASLQELTAILRQQLDDMAILLVQLANTYFPGAAETRGVRKAKRLVRNELDSSLRSNREAEQILAGVLEGGSSSSSSSGSDSDSSGGSDSDSSGGSDSETCSAEDEERPLKALNRVGSDAAAAAAATDAE